MERISDIIELDTLNSSSKITPLDHIPENKTLKKQSPTPIESDLTADDLAFSSLEKIMSGAINDLKK